LVSAKIYGRIFVIISFSFFLFHRFDNFMANFKVNKNRNNNEFRAMLSGVLVV
jgi:hypothetical protein